MPSLNTELIQKLAQGQGITLDTGAADTLLGQTGGDQGRVQSALDLQKSQKAAQDAVNPDNIIGNAQKLQDFYKKSNEPVVASLQAEKQPLQDRYDNLIKSIKGNQGVAENRQTLTTNNELGKRGIASSSGLYQQELTNAVNPITQQYTGMQADALANQNIDLSKLATQIAMAQAGNPEAAMSGGLSFAGLQQNAANSNTALAQNMYNRLNPTAAEDIQTNTARLGMNALQNPQAQDAQYATLSEGQTLYDLLNGRSVYTAPKTYKSTASGGGSSNLPDLSTIFGM